MGVIEVVIMWAFAAAVFVLITRWPMGKECDKRQSFWAKYEGK